MDPVITAFVVAATQVLIGLGTWLIAQNSKRGRQLRRAKRQLDESIGLVYATRNAAMKAGIDQELLPSITDWAKDLDEDD